MKPRKRRNLLPILLVAFGVVMLLFMLMPSIVVKFVNPENLFTAPQTSDQSEVPALQFALSSLQNGDDVQNVDLRTMPGVRVINFWTENCQPCPAEMKNLETLQKASEGAVSVWSISIDKSADRAKRYVTLHPLDIPLYYRLSGELPEDLGRSSTPQSWILIDSTVAYRQRGPVNWADPDFLTWLEKQ